MKKEGRRAAALATAILFIAAVLCSLAFIAAEAGHECAGDDCPVCRMIAFIGNALRRICLLAICASVCAVPVPGETRAAETRVYGAPGLSPVALKVKLSD